MNRLLTLYHSLPRPGRWLAIFVVFIGAYFGIVEPVLAWTAQLNIAADQLRAGLARQRELASADSEPGRALATGRSNFGQPTPPTASTPEAVHRIVDSTLEKHGVHDRTKVEKQGSLTGAPPDAVSALVPGGRIERLVLDVTFETTPETLIAILADLETSREVAAIGRVKIDKSPGGSAGRSSGGSNGSRTGSRTIRATIAPEAWVVVRATPAFGASAFNSSGTNP